MEMAPPAGVTDGLEVLDAAQLQPVIDGGPAHRRGCCHYQKARLFFLLRNNPRGFSIRFCKIVIDIPASKQAGDQLASQKSIVRGQSPENVGVHYIDKPFASRPCVPIDQIVSDREVED